MSVELERVELELHSAALAGLCRICGGRLSNHRVTYECTEHTNGLMDQMLARANQMFIQHAVTTTTGHTDNTKSWKVRGKITTAQYK